MSRSLSPTAASAVFAENTGEVFLTLLAITNPSTSEVVRVANNMADITSNGNVFTAYPFELNLPSDLSDSLDEVQLVIDNVDRSIVDLIRSLTLPATVTLQVILASDPDTIELEAPEMKLKSVQYDGLQVTMGIQYEDVLNNKIPGSIYNPQNAPGLF